MPRITNFDDYIGKQFGKRTILGFNTGVPGRRRAICRCECGNDSQVSFIELVKGKADSCLKCCTKNKKD